MTAAHARSAKRVLLCAALFASASSVRAQTICNSVGETAYCQGSEGSSTMNQVGNITYVNRSDGSSATLQRVGDTTFITDSREGMSGVAQHLGEITIINLAISSSVCNKVGPTMWCT